VLETIGYTKKQNAINNKRRHIFGGGEILESFILFKQYHFSG